MKRRKFFKTAMFTAGAVAFSQFPYHLYAAPSKRYASDRILLGNSGVEVSRLAMGTGTNGFNKRSFQSENLGIHGLSDWLRNAYDNGVNFWDSADQYGTHPHLKETLKHVPRENVVILSKTHARTEKEMRADLDRFKRELGTDYIDILLLHNKQKANWPEMHAGAMNVLSEAKEEGIIKMHGVSCHKLEALKTAAKTPWVDIDLARINMKGVIMDGSLDKVVPVLKEMKDNGKVVMGMKIIGAGQLSDQVDQSLEFALAQKYIDCFTIGTENIEQFDDLTVRIPKASVRG